MKPTHSITPSLLRLCAAVMLATGSLAVHAGSADALQAQSSGVAIDTDRIIVKYRDEAAVNGKAGNAAQVAANRQARVQRSGQQFGLAMKHSHGIATGGQVLKLGKKMKLAEAAAVAADLMARDPSIEYAEPDLILTKQYVPNDARYAEQWDLYETTGGMRLPAAWDKSTGSGVVVAVIDTGYRPHADLSGQIVGGYDFISSATMSNDGNGRDSDASDTGDAVVAGECGNGKPAADQNSSWHGTHVAGTIAAATNNGAGVAGVAFGAKILPVRVLGKCGGYTSDIADAIIWASGGSVTGVPANPNKARVLNMSLGGPGTCGSTTQAAINSARSRGAVVVVAAGNENTNASGSNPANCAGVVTVAATNRSGGRAYYSNYGTNVDVAAPGGDARYAGGGILSTLNAGLKGPAGDSYAFYQGTSMATPHVAGVAALMLAKNAALTPDDIEAKLKSTTRAFPATCSGCGTGIVDASAAVDAAGGGTTTPPVVTLNETESNNTRATSNTVTTSGTTVNGTMLGTTDTDYFFVNLPAGKTLSATLSPGAGNDFDLYVYSSTGVQLGASENGAGVSDSISSANSGTTATGRYVRVVYYAGGTGSAGAYQLKFSW